MSDNLYVSAAGAVSRLRHLEVLANNLANAQTVGFKADGPVFEGMLDAALTSGNGGTVAGAPVSTYVGSAGAGRVDFSEGPVTRTERGLDAAIRGPGFFSVSTPDGVRYTRAGSFVRSPGGELSTRDGHAVLGAGGPISLGDRPVRILADGSVTDDRGASLGRIQVDRFEDPSLLEKQGDGLFRAPALAVGEPVADVALHEASLEQSNVRSVTELANLMILQRAFDASMQALRSDDESTRRLIQEMTQ